MIAFRRSSAIRLAALFLVIVTFGLVAAFAAAYLIVRSEILSRMRIDIAAQAETVVARLQSEPAVAVLSEPMGLRVAALFDQHDSLVAGRAALFPMTGWRQVATSVVHLDEGHGQRSHSVLLYGLRVGDNVLVVGEGTHVIEETGEAMLRALILSLGFVGLFGLAGAAVIAWRVDRRLGRNEEALDAYSSGDIARRLPVSRSGDELDRMALAVNSALDRIAALVETIRQVTTDAAHDLKTPMTRLRHRLAEAEHASAAGLKDILNAAEADAEQIVSTFDAILRIAQIEAGARRARFCDVDLSDLLETVADAYSLDVVQAGQSLETRIAPNLRVSGDRDLLIQSFANLIENSIRHSGSGARLRMLATESGPSVQVTVTDTGPGIPMVDRARVLQRFVRLEASRSTPGTGLGLTLVKAIADLHGARLSLTDNDPGLQVTVAFARLQAKSRAVKTENVAARMFSRAEPDTKPSGAVPITLGSGNSANA